MNGIAPSELRDEMVRTPLGVGRWMPNIAAVDEAPLLHPQMANIYREGPEHRLGYG